MNYTIGKNMVDRFVDITQIADGVWSFLARSPGQGGDARSYLICGTQKALLIDTGFGIGDLSALCRQFTQLPVEVVNTHFHGDHTGGNAQFPFVWIGKPDKEKLVSSIENPMMDIGSPARDAFYAASDVIEQRPYEIRTVEIGHIFDLGGGHLIEVLSTPGHSAGGISLLEKKRRMLFTGDAIVFTPIYMFGAETGIGLSVEEFRDALAVLLTRKGEFDGIFPGHHNMNLAPDYVDDMLACCDDILRDANCNQEWMQVHGRQVKLCRHGNALIAYADARIDALK